LSVSLLRNYCHHFCRSFNRIARSSSSLINAHFAIRRTMRQISIRNSFGGADLHRCRKYRQSPRFLYVVEKRARSIVESAVALGRSTPFVDVFVGPPPWKQLVPSVPYRISSFAGTGEVVSGGRLFGRPFCHLFPSPLLPRCCRRKGRHKARRFILSGSRLREAGKQIRLCNLKRRVLHLAGTKTPTGQTEFVFGEI
jgi:hypothetical protein